MAKTTNSTEKINKVRKNASLFTDSKTFFAYRNFPTNDVMIKRLQDELLQWYFKNPSAKGISGFYIQRGIDPKTYYRWVAKYPDLKEIDEFIRQCIGERLWEDALDKKKGIEWAAAKYRLWRYGKEFREDAEFNTALKSGDEAKGTNIIYVKETIPVEPTPPRSPYIGM